MKLLRVCSCQAEITDRIYSMVVLLFAQTGQPVLIQKTTTVVMTYSVVCLSGPIDLSCCFQYENGLNWQQWSVIVLVLKSGFNLRRLILVHVVVRVYGTVGNCWLVLSVGVIGLAWLTINIIVSL